MQSPPVPDARASQHADALHTILQALTCSPPFMHLMCAPAAEHPDPAQNVSLPLPPTCLPGPRRAHANANVSELRDGR